MGSIVLSLLAETSLHPGAGQVGGAIDLPVTREQTTGYPVIYGSSLKGALRDWLEHNYSGENDCNQQMAKEVFGTQDSAGAIMVTDARLLLLPVRSLNGHFKWVTCPYLLERYRRDCKLVGKELTLELPHTLSNEEAWAQEEETLHLEELCFKAVASNYINKLTEELSSLITHSYLKQNLAGMLVIVSDDEFAYFAQYGLSVNARNKLNEDTKTSENLWYEETVPPETLFYSILMCRTKEKEKLKQIKDLFLNRPFLQVGGNETVGQGWCSVNSLEP